MPRKTKKKVRRRGSGIRDWIRKGHSKIRSYNGYSNAMKLGYNKYGKNQIDKKFGDYAPLVHKGVESGLSKLKQAGYGKCGSGIRRSGNGIRRSGNGIRRSGMGSRLKY